MIMSRAPAEIQIGSVTWEVAWENRATMLHWYLIVCETKIYPTHTGEHSHFNRLASTYVTRAP